MLRTFHRSCKHLHYCHLLNSWTHTAAAAGELAMPGLSLLTPPLTNTRCPKPDQTRSTTNIIVHKHAAAQTLSTSQWHLVAFKALCAAACLQIQQQTEQRLYLGMQQDRQTRCSQQQKAQEATEVRPMLRNLLQHPLSMIVCTAVADPTLTTASACQRNNGALADGTHKPWHANTSVQCTPSVALNLIDQPTSAQHGAAQQKRVMNSH
jgi:hypothetical protein